MWDVVAFDEAAGVRFTDKSGLNIMKGYMEDGAFSRGRDIITAEGSVRLRRQHRRGHRDDHQNVEPLLSDAKGDGHGVL